MRAVCTPRACLVYARLEHAEHGSPFSHFFARFREVSMTEIAPVYPV